jgi:hypothetical protein
MPVKVKDSHTKIKPLAWPVATDVTVPERALVRIMLNTILYALLSVIRQASQ